MDIRAQVPQPKTSPPLPEPRLPATRAFGPAVPGSGNEAPASPGPEGHSFGRVSVHSPARPAAAPTGVIQRVRYGPDGTPEPENKDEQQEMGKLGEDEWIKKYKHPALAVPRLLRQSESGQKQLDKAKFREDHGFGGAAFVPMDLPFREGGEAMLDHPNKVFVNQNHNVFKNAAVAAHELQHHHQYFTGQITHDSDHYDKASAEIPAKLAGLAVYQQLKDKIQPDDPSTGAEAADLQDYEKLGAKAYHRQVFKNYYQQYHPKRENTAMSDEQIDEHLAAQQAYRKAKEDEKMAKLKVDALSDQGKRGGEGDEVFDSAYAEWQHHRKAAMAEKGKVDATKA